MISIIVGTSENKVIGHLNDIPWYLPRDLQHFKETTTGHTVFMGRKTFDSIVKRIGKPLPNRKNVILTTQKDFSAPGCYIVHSWDEALKVTKDEDVYVSGGADIYKQALTFADRLILTIIHTTCDGDTFFEFNENDWNLITSNFYPKDEKNQYDCTINIYERRK